MVSTATCPRFSLRTVMTTQRNSRGRTSPVPEHPPIAIEKDALELQEGSLHVTTPAELAHGAVGPHDAMTRNEERDRIASDGRCDRADRPGPPRVFGHPRVGAHGAERDGAHCFNDVAQQRGARGEVVVDVGDLARLELPFDRRAEMVGEGSERIGAIHHVDALEASDARDAAVGPRDENRTHRRVAHAALAHGRQRTRGRASPWAVSAMVFAVVASAGCRHNDKATPTTTTRRATNGTVTTLAVAAVHGMTLDQYITRFAHDPDNDRPTLANNGFVNADRDPVSNTIAIYTLHFQGRDGAAEVKSSLASAASQRKDSATFTVDGVDGATGVRWREQGRSTGDVTIEQVLFTRETSLIIVEATLPPGTTSTDDVRAAARRRAG